MIATSEYRSSLGVLFWLIHRPNVFVWTRDKETASGNQPQFERLREWISSSTWGFVVARGRVADSLLLYMLMLRAIAEAPPCKVVVPREGYNRMTEGRSLLCSYEAGSEVSAFHARDTKIRSFPLEMSRNVLPQSPWPPIAI